MKIGKLILVLILTAFSLFSNTVEKPNKSTYFDEIKKNAPKIYIDCDDCDLDYVRTNVSFVNYVTDVKEAQIYLLISYLNTGSGGRRYTFEFSGLKRFKGLDEKIELITSQSDTDDEIRKEVVKTLKIGLIRYIKNSDLAKYINISFEKKLDPTKTVDRWKSWVFNIDMSGWFDGGESNSGKRLMYAVSADRITPKSRIMLKMFSSVYSSYFKIKKGEEIRSVKKGKVVKGVYVKSINDHLSVGGNFRVLSSTYRNKDMEFSLSPAIEYNIYPYSEATKKQLRIKYSLGYRKIKYIEKTIYDKKTEDLYYQEISAALKLKQKWGSISTSLTGFTYFHDLKKYSIRLHSSISWRIIKGLSFRLRGGYSIIHNQLYLPKGELTKEEILLNVSAMSTSYEYWFSAGINFRFGSIYNNVVNPRFGY